MMVSKVREAVEISTHTPLARRDAYAATTPTTLPAFQLTRLLRGVTEMKITIELTEKISTHTPLARRDTAITCSP